MDDDVRKARNELFDSEFDYALHHKILTDADNIKYKEEKRPFTDKLKHAIHEAILRQKQEEEEEEHGEYKGR